MVVTELIIKPTQKLYCRNLVGVRTHNAGCADLRTASVVRRSFLIMVLCQKKRGGVKKTATYLYNIIMKKAGVFREQIQETVLSLCRNVEKSKKCSLQRTALSIFSQEWK